jgi:L-threonylcarbamoyladenylate synthase
VSSVRDAIDALRAGQLAIVPTDTVYGLACEGTNEAAAQRLYAAKRRPVTQPTALVFASVETLFELVPDLPEDAVFVARALLPGPVTIVLPNPGRRFAWLNPERPEAIGVRVPVLAGSGRAVLDGVAALVATSANLPGGPDPQRLEDVPFELRSAAAAVVDGGVLPGMPSTVIDVTDAEPRVVREGALPADEALARLVGSRDS